MRVTLDTRDDGRHTLTLGGTPWPGPLTDHDLNDIEAFLAQRKAMARLCPGEDGEHTCTLPPGHLLPHMCRACRHAWTSLQDQP